MVKPSYSVPLYKRKSLGNKKCGSNKCDNPVNRRVLFSLGFSASFCEKCADELIRNNLGVEDGFTCSSMGKDVNNVNGSLSWENE